jgi:hypothetical protein
MLNFAFVPQSLGFLLSDLLLEKFGDLDQKCLSNNSITVIAIMYYDRLGNSKNIKCFGNMR